VHRGIDGELWILALAHVDPAPLEPGADVVADRAEVAHGRAHEHGEAAGHGRRLAPRSHSGVPGGPRRRHTLVQDDTVSCHRARGGDRIPSIWGRGAARSTQTGKGAAAVGIAANAWYRLEVLVVGTTITVTLYDDKGTQVDQLAEFADRATIQGGVAFGVA